jgi:uncharacterized protein YecE (DUF72 family)
LLLIGTSGFSYKDWVGPYYPEGLPKKDWLSFHSREFSTCEINFSYYTVPNPRTLAAMAAKVPDGFLFTLKANREMTHERGDNQDVFRQFSDSLAPWLEQGKLGCILAQFPASFRATAENRDYLKVLRDRLGGLRVVVEFRHVGWVSPATFELLRELNLGFCSVDQPRFKSLMPPVAEVTSDTAYVRFHGRNYQKWWRHKEAWERYDYTYSANELEEWVPKIRQMDEEAETTFLFANNHWRGQAVDTARQLRMLLV